LRFKIFKSKQKDRIHEKNTSNIEWPDHVVTINGENFDEFIKKYPLSVVDFWAPWCTPCRAMTPRLRRLSKIYKGRVAFGKLNTQENQDVPKQYKVMGIPHLMFFSYGKKIAEITGVRSIGELKTLVDRFLN